MKLINPSVELYSQENYTLDGIYKQIERCARVSYKSEDKITETSSKAFVDNLIKAGHYAPLEFGTVYLQREIDYNENKAYYNTFEHKYSKNQYTTVTYDGAACYVTTNYRVIIENGWTDDLKYLCEPTAYHIKRHCVKFTTSIGIAREFTRHRVFSFMQESTRYCNYSKRKFGGEITYIIPTWCDFNPAQIEEYENGNFEHSKVREYALLSGLLKAEDCYITMLSDDCTPQQARDVLPLATKTELVMCGFGIDWIHFFALRLKGTTGAPHPDAKYLAQEAWNLFRNAYPIYRNNIEL